MQQQFIFPKCFALDFKSGVPGAVLVDTVELRNMLDNSIPCCLVYPLPWQICNQPDHEAQVQNWISAMAEFLVFQGHHTGQLKVMPLDVYFQICKVEITGSFQSSRFHHLGALLFANSFPEAFDLLTTMEGNAELNGRDPFVRFDYPSLPVGCIDDLKHLKAEVDLPESMPKIEEQHSSELMAQAELNIRLMEQIRLMQESLERNYLENQVLRYEAERSAKTMQSVYRLIMDRSAARSREQ